MKATNMKKYLLKIIPVLAFLATTIHAPAQGPGSVETIGGTAGTVVYGTATGNTTSSASETLYMGPGIYQIDGTWEIYSKNVWVSPDAVIAGSGIVRFFNPSVAGGAASPTLIDGNNNAAFLNVNLSLQNAGNMVLTDIAGPGAPWNDAAGNANLTTGLDFAFAVANGDVLLGDYDMIIATNATLSGYQPSQFVVTNGSGHLVHNSYTGAFTYPVGITEGDYTPAAINNAIINAIHVSVQDYATSASDEIIGSDGNGVQRTWNIYADNATGNSTVNLQHNSTTNQNNFVDASHFVTQWSNTTPNTTGDLATSQNAWQSNTSGGGATGNLSSTGTVTGSSMRSRDYTSFATSASDAMAYFSKSSNQLMPLPVTLISFAIRAETCSNIIVNWKVSDAVNFSRFELEKSADGTSFQAIGVISFDPATSEYSYPDNIQATGNYFYRLKMIDNDGRYKYSSIAMVRSNCADKTIVLFPNPARGIVTISGLQKGELIQLYGTNGQLLISKKAMNYQEQLDLSKYPAGTYNMIIRNEKEKLMTTKVIRID
jgi:hypothetical protein